MQTLVSLAAGSIALMMIAMIYWTLRKKPEAKHDTTRKAKGLMADLIKFLVIFPAALEIVLRGWFVWDTPLHGLTSVHWIYLSASAFLIAIVTQAQIGTRRPRVLRWIFMQNPHNSDAFGNKIRRTFAEPLWFILTVALQILFGLFGHLLHAIWPVIGLHILYNTLCYVFQVQDFDRPT